MRRIITCVFITLALILAGSFMPVIGVIGLMICPLPLSILGCIEGHKRASIAELLIEATLFLAVSPLMAVYFLIGCAPVSAVVFMLSRQEFKEAKNYSGAESLLICSGVSILMKLVMLLAFWIFTGRNMLLPDLQQMNIILSQLYGNDPQVQDAVRRVLTLIPHLTPAMIVIYSSAEAYLNYTLCRSIILKYFPKVNNFPSELPPFMLWRFPVSLIFALIVSSIFRYFIDVDDFPEISTYIMNLQIVIDLFMFINGLAFGLWLMNGFRIRRITKIIFFILFTIPFFWPWLMVMGMSDMALNLRDRIKFKSQN